MKEEVIATSENVEAQALQFERAITEAKEHYLKSQQLSVEAHDAISETLKEAVLCGLALTKARDSAAEGKVKFKDLLQTYWPEISKSTVYNYIDLAAESKSFGLLGDVKTKSDAYRLLGKLKPRQAPETGNGGQGTTFTIDVLAPRTRFLTRLAERKDEILNWPEEDRQRLQDALKPAVDLYSSINGMKGEVINA